MITLTPLFNEKTQFAMALAHLGYLGHPEGSGLAFLQQLPNWSNQFPKLQPARDQEPNQNCPTEKDCILHFGLLQYDPKLRFSARVALKEVLKPPAAASPAAPVAQTPALPRASSTSSASRHHRKLPLLTHPPQGNGDEVPKGAKRADCGSSKVGCIRWVRS
jgi:hypothetical protein